MKKEKKIIINLAIEVFESLWYARVYEWKFGGGGEEYFPSGDDSWVGIFA